MIDLVGLAYRVLWVQPARRLVVPGGFSVPEELRGAIHLAAGADQAVAGKQLVLKPGHAGLTRGAVFGLVLAIDGVEPQRYLGQLHRHRVQVNAEGIAVGQVHAHLPQLARVGLVRDAPTQLGLL